MTSSVPVNGYLYIAWGKRHIAEAKASVATLRKHDRSAHVTLATDTDTDGEFDRVVVKDIRPGLGGKVDSLSNEYYTNTFCLDTDTYICADPSGLFQLLAYFDVCLVQGPVEQDAYMEGLTPYNTGVMLVGPKTTELFKKFRQYYNDDETRKAGLVNHPGRSRTATQPSFMLAIRNTNVRVHALSNVWNARYRFKLGLMGEVKIIHGPTTDFEKLEKEMNRKKGNRVWRGKR